MTCEKIPWGARSNNARPTQGTMKAFSKNTNGSGRVASSSNAMDAAATTATSRVVVRRKINPFSPPTTLELSGVRVHFPFTPYPCQETYMQTVMNALLKSENALLESPTGTGKTLCLLCACLAWQRQQALLCRNGDEHSDLSSTLPSAAATTATPNMDIMNASSQKPQQQQRRPPTIVYASRTHSQLSQVVRELRSTRYRPSHAVLGSREHMCIHPKVKRPNATPSDINHDCNKLSVDRKCRFRSNLDGFRAPLNEYSSVDDCTKSARNGVSASSLSSSQNQQHQPVMDMEELVAMGKTHSVCPFYYTRAQVERAELILVPYNYLFDKDARESTLADIAWDNAVVIFDEAHNLESFASESASFDLTSGDIAGCISEVTKVLNLVQAVPETGNTLRVDNLIRLKSIFLKLEDFINNLGVQTAYNGEYMMEVFQQSCGITHANHQLFIDEARKVNDVLMDLRGGSTASSSRGASPKLEHFIQCLKRVFGFPLESRCLAKASLYRVHVSPKTFVSNPPGSATGYGANTSGRTISYWCFAPSLAMEELANLNIRSILVTSGTLSPLPSYSMELGLSFPHTLENPHIISSQQIHVRVIGKGVTGKLLNSSYERRKDKDYALELGNTLVSIAKVTPAGMLIFFPSYSVMESCIEEWGGPSSSRSHSTGKNDFFAKRRKPTNKATPFAFPFAPVHFATDMSARPTPWKRMLSTKAVVIEPKSAADLPDALAEFKKFLGLQKSTGCILMGVCRGKISEGIDFADEQSRAVVITGLPFPPSFDAKVKMKREYLDNARANSNIKVSGEGGFGAPSNMTASRSNRLSGHEWYTQQAHRAVNQAIGRVIRHQKDYGAVLLLDSRFDQSQNQAGLSKWLRCYLQKDEGIGVALKGLVEFYKSADAYIQEIAMKEATQKPCALSRPILQYDDDYSEQDELPSKVAVIRRGNQGLDSFVKPSDVVARLDVNSLVQRREHAMEEFTSKNEDVLPRTGNANDVIFGKRSSASSVTDSKEKKFAIQFMDMVKENLKNSDQSIIRSAIVAMKGAGEKQDVKLYLKSAKAIISLVIRCYPFEAPATRETKMLFLFFALLPKHYRKRVELMSFEMVFESSGLGELVRQNSESDYETLRLATGALLQTLWCRSSDVPLPTEIYIREAKNVLEKLPVAETTPLASMILKEYIKLVPRHFHSFTHAWAAEKISSRNMRKIKEGDKMKASEASVNSSLFQSSFVPMEQVIKTETRRDPLVHDSSQGQAVKRKLAETSSIRRSKPTVNPYAKKMPANFTPDPSTGHMTPKDEILTVPPQPIVKAYKSHHKQPVVLKLSIQACTTASLQKNAAVRTVKSSFHASSDDQTKPIAHEEASLSSILQQAQSEAYIKPHKDHILQSIKTNAPHTITCPICSNVCKDPFVAECGHISCLSCWLDWLNRSKSCMHCKARVTRESLARLVYETKSSSGAPPTLAQLCADNDSDDELEIC